MFLCFLTAVAATGTDKECSATLTATPAPQCTNEECQYLGTGYNIIRGEPIEKATDTGWTLNIFDRDWTTANAQAFELHSCGYDAVVSSISGGRSAQASLNSVVAISGSAGGWGANVAFTGSESTQTMNNSAWSEFTHFEEASASCEIVAYKLPIPSNSRLSFDKSFEEMVRLLLSAKGEGSDEALENLMKKYGTHYSSGITMGGRMTMRWTMTESSYKTLQEDAQTNKYSIEAGFEGLFSVSAGASYDKDQAATKAVEKATTGQVKSEFYQGGTPFVQGDIGKWAAGLKKDGLAPLTAGTQSMLRPITELLTPLNFPDLDAALVQKVQATAEEFCQRLCTPGGPHLGSPSCTAFATDPLIISPTPIATGSLINSVAWAQDGGNVSISQANGYVRTYDVLTHEAWRALKVNPVHSKYALVAYSPDGKHLATGNQIANPTGIQIWDTATDSTTLTLKGSGTAEGGFAYSPDGKHLASGSSVDGTSDGTVKIWDTATGDNTLTLFGHKDKVNSVAYRADGKQLASASNDGTVKVWDMATPAGKNTLTLDAQCVRGAVAVVVVLYSPDGKQLALGCADGTVKFWDPVTGANTLTLLGPSRWRVSMAYSPDGKHLATNGNLVQIWDTATGVNTRNLPKHSSGSTPVAYSPNGLYLALGNINGDALMIERV